MKDNFSVQSHQYVKFRPGYPPEMFDFLMSQVTGRNMAWDCATGNGQIAKELSPHFKSVYATDISKRQLEYAFKRENITYKLESAENATFPDRVFDLVTVGQAIHWFNFDDFYAQVRRTIRPGGILAAAGYGLIQADETTNAIIRKLHTEIVGPCWDEERRFIDEEYRTIPFPFNEIKAPAFQNQFSWSFEQLVGYLETWSAVHHYHRLHGCNPLELIYSELEDAWRSNNEKRVRFPILLRVARL